MKNFKVAIIQHKAVPNDVKANLELALKYITQAKEKGCDIVLFPEMWSNGYAAPFDGAFDNPLNPKYERERNKWLDDAISQNSKYVQLLQNLAKKLDIGIVATYLESTQGEAQTTQGEAQTAQDEAQTTQGEAQTAQGEVQTAQGEAQTAQGEAQTTQGEVQTAQGEAQTAQGEAQIALGEAESTKSKPQNTAIIIDKKGKIILNYAKVHTCDFSLEILLKGGTKFAACDFCGVRLGVMICYDREFPESARILMLQGAQIILVPNACDMNTARLNQLSTRAFENMVGIAMANYPEENWGNSCAFSPIVFDENGKYVDNTIIKADDKSEEILVAEFDLEKINQYRKTETWGNAYRKPQVYAPLLEQEVKPPFVRKKLQ